MSLLLALSLAITSPASAGPPPAPAPAAAAKPVGTVAVEEAAIRAALADVYAIISGPAGQKRDWARMKSLFTSDARLYAAGRAGLRGGSVDDYIANNGPNLEKVGFTERELTTRVQMYGNVAQAWSSYHGTSTDGTVNIRGINSFQLARQPDGRWLVHSILWQQERPDLRLPADMERR
jgi:hypothetical protein